MGNQTKNLINWLEILNLIKLGTSKREPSRKQADYYNNKIQLLNWFIIWEPVLNNQTKNK